MKAPQDGLLANSIGGEKKNINSELWHACAGPLVSLPPVGSLVVYFPQGHSEQVAASMHKETDFVPNYPNLPSKLICMLHNVTLHSDLETDEVYAQMTLQPVTKYDKEGLLASDIGLKQSRQPTEFFCKTLTASDTSTHGGFSVPRRAAEKIFPPLDYSMQPPAQELVARDLHDTSWTFRHIYRGQPKRHLLTTGWSVFVSTKRLFAGDSVLFIRDEKSQLLLGIRRANRQQPPLSSSVISSDSMHIGILASAAHAASNNSPFTIFYNPRASPSEFVIPLAKYNKAMYTQVSLGMRFRMMFETEELGVRRYMGTITGISDLDSLRWKSSQWRNLQVGWDESAAGERPGRVSIWEVEPVITPFYICPPPFFRPKLPKQPGMPDDESEIESAFKRAMPWLGDEFSMKDTQSPIFPGLSLVQWMNMQQNNQAGFLPSLVSPNARSLHNNLTTDDPSKFLSFQTPVLSSPAPPYDKSNHQGQVGQLQQPSSAWPQQHQPQPQPQPQPLSQAQPLLQIPTSLQLHRQQPHCQQNNQILPQQQVCQPPPSNNNGFVGNQIQNQNLQHLVVPTQLQQQELLAGNGQIQQNMNRSFQMASLPQDSTFQQQMEQQINLVPRNQQQPGLSQRAPQTQPAQQLPQQTPLDHQLHVQMLQKLQQQQQQLLFSANPSLQSQPVQIQQSHHQNHPAQNTNAFSTSGLLQSQHMPQPQPQPQPQPKGGHFKPLNAIRAQSMTDGDPPSCSTSPSTNNGHVSTSNIFNRKQGSVTLAECSVVEGLLQSQHMPQPQSLSQPKGGQFKPLNAIRAQSMTDGDAPSCSTSPSTNNCHVSTSNIFNRKQGPVTLAECSVVEPSNNLLQELQSKYDSRIKHELCEKGPDLIKFKKPIAEQLEASSSGTSYCLAAGPTQQPTPLPVSIDNDVHFHHRMNIPFMSNIDGLMPDSFSSREYDSPNLLSNYTSLPRDIDTELSSAPISPQPFGVRNMPLNPTCSNDVPINDSGAMGSGLWANHSQRMRTYTKVQKRGSVGRCIDLTRYRGYGDLRCDVARMFGIEGRLEDPQRTDWKLVYVDHENDILLVGDDPWEEFVSCVQSIKILSSAEVQQMSMDGDLGQIQIPNQACSGTDSGNAWHSAASFSR